ncbi:MAG TPA: DUF4124 domain-containing protein [Usitatibacter sp.]|nr:DUF4124 domain-containing protein [Usitatibacter sp.]
MKSAWIAAAIAVTATTSVLAQTTIYKHVDESGRVTYSNKPMKGATVMELEPITTIPTAPAPAARAPAPEKSAKQPVPASLTVTQPSLAAVEPQLQRKRDDERRRILERELAEEEQSLSTARNALTQEQQNPTLIAAVRTAQQTSDPTPAQMMEMRAALDKASGRIRGLQATVAEHEKNVEALKKELGALKP